VADHRAGTDRRADQGAHPRSPGRAHTPRSCLLAVAEMLGAQVVTDPQIIQGCSRPGGS
jgi:hypothetical protein